MLGGRPQAYAEFDATALDAGRTDTNRRPPIQDSRKLLANAK